jgi:hypothetical protein
MARDPGAQDPDSDGLRTPARIVMALSAFVAEALMLFAGRENRHYEITALFIVWVGSPFVLLWAADRASRSWPRPVQTTLSWLMLLVACVTVAAYVRRIVRPPAVQAAFVFVLVPPVSWLVIALAIGVAFLIATRSHR